MGGVQHCRGKRPTGAPVFVFLASPWTSSYITGEIADHRRP
jgi:hypothetical protein